MIRPEKEAKLLTFLHSVPQGPLRQLRQACAFGAETDPGGMPYDRLIWLIEDVAHRRGLVLEAQQENLNDLSEPAEATLAHDEVIPEEPVVEVVAPMDFSDSEDFIVEEAVGDVKTGGHLDVEEVSPRTDKIDDLHPGLIITAVEAAFEKSSDEIRVDCLANEVGRDEKIGPLPNDSIEPEKREPEGPSPDEPTLAVQGQARKDGEQPYFNKSDEGAVADAENQEQGTQEEEQVSIVGASGQASQAEEELATIPEEETFVVPRNAMHAFFLPFAPLIIDPVKYLPRVDGYICSTSLPAIWRLLNEETSGAVIRDAWVKSELQPESQGAEFYQQITSEMHAAARVVMDSYTERSREDPAWRRTLISRLGGNAVLGDFAEFQALLPFSNAFHEVFDLLVPAIDRFGTEDIDRIAGEIIATEEVSSALPGYLQLAVLARLAAPWQGLRLYAALRDDKNQCADHPQTRQTKAELTLICDHLAAMLDAESAWLEQKCLGDSLEPGIHEAMQGFCRLLGGLAQEVELAGLSIVRKRLETSTMRGGQIFACLMKQSMGAIHKVLPLDIVDGQGEMEQGLQPDPAWLGREVGATALIEQAGQATHLLTDSNDIALALGKMALLRRTRKRAGEELDTYLDQLVPVVSQSTGERRLQAMRLADHVLDLARQLLGDDRTNHFKAAVDDAARAA